MEGGLAKLGSHAFVLPGLSGAGKMSISLVYPAVKQVLDPTITAYNWGLCVECLQGWKYVHKILLLWPNSHILLPLVRLPNERIPTQECKTVPCRSASTLLPFSVGDSVVSYCIQLQTQDSCQCISFILLSWNHILEFCNIWTKFNNLTTANTPKFYLYIYIYTHIIYI